MVPHRARVLSNRVRLPLSWPQFLDLQSLKWTASLLQQHELGMHQQLCDLQVSQLKEFFGAIYQELVVHGALEWELRQLH